MGKYDCCVIALQIKSYDFKIFNSNRNSNVIRRVYESTSTFEAASWWTSRLPQAKQTKQAVLLEGSVSEMEGDMRQH